MSELAVTPKQALEAQRGPDGKPLLLYQREVDFEIRKINAILCRGFHFISSEDHTIWSGYIPEIVQAFERKGWLVETQDDGSLSFSTGRTVLDDLAKI